MMTIFLVVIAVLLVVRALALPGEAKSGAALCLQVVPWIVASGILYFAWSSAEPSAESWSPRTVAVSPSGQPVHTVVVFEPENAKRVIKKIPFAVDRGQITSFAALVWCFSSLALLLGLRQRRSERTSMSRGTFLIILSTSVACALLVYMVAIVPAGGNGEADVRAFLSRFESSMPIASFTVPATEWSFPRLYVVPASIALGFSMLGLALPRLPQGPGRGIPFATVAAFACLAAVAYQAMITQGFPWRPLEVALLAGLASLIAAGVHRQHFQASLVAFGSAVGLLAFWA